MPKQWDKQDATSAYMYIANGMFLELRRDSFGENEWQSIVWAKTSPTLRSEIMSWEFQASSIESAKDLAHAKLRLWLAELVERVG